MGKTIDREHAMSLTDCDVLRTLAEEPYTGQRALAEKAGCSLGAVNRSLKNLTEAGLLDSGRALTPEAVRLLETRRPRNAVILAAGAGMRMVPINYTAPKALLEVKGERLIERTIRQLKEAGISDITVVVGFMKESFEYLMDEYGVKLAVNERYAVSNNIVSLSRVMNRLSGTYVVPCDLWCAENPFRRFELYSWYMVSEAKSEESEVRVSRKMELVKEANGNRMIGIAYLLPEEAEKLSGAIRRMTGSGRDEDQFWEAALYDGGRMILPARVVPDAMVTEINTYEQLRDLDASSDHLQSDAIETIEKALHCAAADVRNIRVLKKGMTNRSFLFSVGDARYIMRVPGEGTDRLINRAQEAEVFRTISGLGFCDDPVYINPENGYKITKYLEGVRTCDPENEEDLIRCMAKLRQFHAMRLRVGHTFDLFGQIAFYESLWEGTPSVYRDYAATREKIFSLKDRIADEPKDWCLTHIDAVPDNFLFYPGPDGEALQLTDWEYAGMQDPHVDIAMFCIYSLYDKAQCDRLIDLYFEGACDRRTRLKIYAYIAVCGLLWSNWCEYKRKLGVEFGEYALRQYRYAKDFYRYAAEERAEEKI